MSSGLTASQIDRFTQDGYLLVPEVISGSELLKLRDDAMAAWGAAKPQGAVDDSATWVQSSLLPNVHHVSERVRAYYWKGPPLAFAASIIGPNIKGATAQLTFKLRGNTKKFGWHQDNGYGELDPYNSVSCLTALDAADEANGCLWVIPQSHHRGQLLSLTAEEKREGVEATLHDVDESAAVPVPMGAGCSSCATPTRTRLRSSTRAPRGSDGCCAAAAALPKCRPSSRTLPRPPGRGPEELPPTTLWRST